MSRGSALADTLVAAFITALFLQGAVAAAHLQAAGETAHEAAAVAAAWAARYGDTAEAASLARALAPEAESVSVRNTAARLGRHGVAAGPSGRPGRAGGTRGGGPGRRGRQPLPEQP